MNAFDALFLSLTGFLIAVPSSMAGLGGGFLIVPALILIFQLPAQNAVAVSLIAMSGTTISATIAYVRQRRVDYMLGLLYDVLDIPGVVVGAYLTTLLPSNLLAGLVGFLMAVISLFLIMHKETESSLLGHRTLKIGSKAWKRRKTDSSGKSFEYFVRRLGLALLSSLAGGIVTGLAGLGGGITDTATMILLGVPPHIAVASSEFAMALTNATAVMAHGFLKNILVDYALPLVVGTVIGAQVGSLFAKRAKEKTLRKLLSVVAFFAGLRLILTALM